MHTSVEVRGQTISLSDIVDVRLSMSEAREILTLVEGMEGDIRYLDVPKLRQIAKMLAGDKSLADIARKTGIPLAVAENGFDGEERLILREEVASFGTWLGQRDDTLKEVPASNFTVSDDLRGCLNAKRNIVVAYQRGDLTTATLTDYLDQRYAVGDMTLKRNLVSTAVTVAMQLGLGEPGGSWSFMVQDAYDSVNGSGGIPGAVWGRVLDIVFTAHENLIAATANIRKALSDQDLTKLRRGLESAAWVNKAAVSAIYQTAELAAGGNKPALKRLGRLIIDFCEEVDELVAGGPDEFFVRLKQTGLISSLCDRYLPDEGAAAIEREAREWLRERGLARQTPVLLSHVTWALRNGEVALLETCLEDRKEGKRDWEAPLLAAQIGETA